eukprot:TRINITY_DN9289_c0_g1_i1.p1 TRINITY_DN9289_c0_g1~~TRINITY_DN9289_c0_g1_i1.p1  ORF type:complete len:154 (-),score=15.75 TRINITY_DN9289_c0_g1_i1:253-714(-)
MDAMVMDDEEGMRSLKEGRRRQSVEVKGDEWLYELEEDPKKADLALQSARGPNDPPVADSPNVQSASLSRAGSATVPFPETHSAGRRSISGSSDHHVNVHAPLASSPKATPPAPSPWACGSCSGFVRVHWLAVLCVLLASGAVFGLIVWVVVR